MINNINNYKNYFFLLDMDGTILDTDYLHYLSYNYIFNNEIN